MKKQSIHSAWTLLIIGLIILASCEKKYTDDYEPYGASTPSAEKIGLTYNTPLETYPASGVILSDTPTFSIAGPYLFAIDTVYASPGASFNYNRFGINDQSGVISYDNTSSTITEGTYMVNVAVVTISGAAFIDSVFEIRVLNVPINATATPDNVVVDALETGVISALTYEVIGNPDPPVTDVTFAVDPPVTGFSVNDQGEVLKDAITEVGEYVLSFTASTSYGDKLFPDLLTVVVEGSAPTLQYTQQDGATPLTQVTLSPWTAYSTSPPVLGGISADSWSLILPDGTPQELSNAISIGQDGGISIAAEANIPDGSYPIGVTVTTAGAPFDFQDLFTIHVETRWGETPVLSETFDYAVEGGTLLEPPFSSLTVNSGVPEKKFNAVNFIKDDPPRDLHSARLLYGKDGSYDVAMVLHLTNGGTWRNLRIKFSQLFGYGDVVLEFFERTLWYAHENETVNGTFTPANWTQVMGVDDPEWLSENLWASPVTLNDGDLPSTSYKQLGGLDPTQDEVFICWRYFTEGNPDKGAQWFIDDVYVQAAEAYDAEED